ncbi:MAG TPA: HAD-IIA family hydrolase [Limnochordia bacterium]
MPDLTRYRAILFDVDGVLRRGEQPVPGAAEAVRRVRALGKRVGVVTNNSAYSARGIHAALAALGFDFEPGEIFAAPRATAAWMMARPGGRRAFVLGTDGLKEELTEQGIECIDAPETVDYRCDYLVVAGCLHINYELLTQALRVGLTGACFVAVNRDRMFPGSSGMHPGAGAIVGAVSGMLGRDPDIVIGKPSPHLAHYALAQLGVAAAECLLIGDTLDSDVAFGKAAGMDTALVLTGIARADEITPETAPTFVLPSVAAIGADPPAPEAAVDEGDSALRGAAPR